MVIEFLAVHRKQKIVAFAGFGVLEGEDDAKCYKMVRLCKLKHSSHIGKQSSAIMAISEKCNLKVTKATSKLQKVTSKLYCLPFLMLVITIVELVLENEKCNLTINLAARKNFFNRFYQFQFFLRIPSIKVFYFRRIISDIAIEDLRNLFLL